MAVVCMQTLERSHYATLAFSPCEGVVRQSCALAQCMVQSSNLSCSSVVYRIPGEVRSAAGVWLRVVVSNSIIVGINRVREE